MYRDKHRYPGITFYSDPMDVSMSASWYEVSTADHFWIKRRFAVMGRLVDGLDLKTMNWFDVGCGTGLLQTHCQNKYGLKITGADLNMAALSQNPSGPERTFCYDILEKRAEWREAYDMVSALDVIEHIDDEFHFLEALLFHLKKGGFLMVDVPANQKMYSRYDAEVGHKRRYSSGDISRICSQHGLTVYAWTYWGLGLLPVLVARNCLVACVAKEKVIEKGFSAPNKATSMLLKALAGAEWLPNHLTGTSLLFILRK